MAEYAIRVQLMGNPTAEEYESLHSIMSDYDFSRTIAGTDADGNNRDFNLPHGVYYGSSNSGVAAVRDKISKAVKDEVQEKIIVFVVEATTWAIGR